MRFSSLSALIPKITGRSGSSARCTARQRPAVSGVRNTGCSSPTTAMTHIAIQEKLNGSPVTWMEKVTNEQYRK